jgi:hypothetical protein
MTNPINGLPFPNDAISTISAQAKAQGWTLVAAIEDPKDSDVVVTLCTGQDAGLFHTHKWYKHSPGFVHGHYMISNLDAGYESMAERVA